MTKQRCDKYCPNCRRKCMKDNKHKGSHFCGTHGHYRFIGFGAVEWVEE